VDESPKTRRQTPRVPSNFLYSKLVPIAIGLMAVILLVLIVAVLLPLFRGGY
jgi:type II secretory pathway component PulF